MFCSGSPDIRSARGELPLWPCDVVIDYPSADVIAMRHNLLRLEQVIPT